MLTFKEVKTLTGDIETITVESDTDQVIDTFGRLTMLPALIDIHVHLRTPGHQHKEDWIHGAKAAVAGGITTVFDMPNNDPPFVDEESLILKKSIIDGQLKDVGIPLHYGLYIGADKNHFDAIGKVKKDIVGIKVYMGSSTGGLVMDDPVALDRVFQIGAQENLIVSVHAEDEEILQKNQETFRNETTPKIHSKIRHRSAAIKATEDAIQLSEKYNGQLLIHHVTTKEEIELIRQAKKRGILVYCEVTPHHLFLTDNDYEKWGTKVQCNPPIRDKSDVAALWDGIHDGTVDIIGSDHAPHTLEEKEQPYGKAPSGIPEIELTLPLLLNCVNEGKLSLDDIVRLMRVNPENIYNIPRNHDIVLVDMKLTKKVDDASLKTKCGWSPYHGLTLTGWPVMTVLNGTIYKPEDL